MRLLVVEDNLELALLLTTGFERAGYEVDSVTTVADANLALTRFRPAAIILDLGLPDGDGRSLLVEIRAKEDPIPVVVLTARSSVADRVLGLRSGADDYLVKPFAFEELTARLEAVLRRPGQLLGRSLQLANLTFDTESREALIDGRVQPLSAREADMLEILLRRQGRVVPKRIAEDHLFGLTGEINSNAIEVYVYRLRKQLAEGGAKVEISTIRGVGYMIHQES